MPLRRPALEAVLAGETVAKPDPRHEVRRHFLEDLEVPVERQQDERVLLSASPAPLLAMAEQPPHQLRDQVAARLVPDQRLQQQRVGPPVGVQQQVRPVAVARREVRRARRLGDPIAQVAVDLLQGRGRLPVAAQHRDEPAQRLQRQLVHPTRLADQPAGSLRVPVTEQLPHIERVRRDDPANVLAIRTGEVPLDALQVALRSAEHALGDLEALRLRPGQGVGDVHRQIGPRRVPALPEREAAVRVLHALQHVDVLPNRRHHRLRRWQPLGIERREHVLERRDGDHPRRPLLRALVGIAHQIQHGVGQSL